MPRAAGGLCVGAVAPCISPGGWFALKISLARCSRPPARRGLHSAAGIFRAVSGALVALFFLRGRARGLVFGARDHFVLYAAPTSHGAYTACCPLPPRCCGCLRFVFRACSNRCLYGVTASGGRFVRRCRCAMHLAWQLVCSANLSRARALGAVLAALVVCSCGRARGLACVSVSHNGWPLLRNAATACCRPSHSSRRPGAAAAYIVIRRAFRRCHLSQACLSVGCRVGAVAPHARHGTLRCQCITCACRR
jgi:hypothetical protein